MARIIAGTAKNLQLETPSEGTRPITDRAKAALFSILFDWIKDARILDLYAGSGSLGIEALSRGAKFVMFVDNSVEAISCIEKNLKKSKLEDLANFVLSDAEEFIENTNEKPFDLIFLDPPYPETKTEQIAIVEKLLVDSGLVVLKHSPKFKTEERVGGLKLIDSRTYGENVISFYQKSSN